MRRIDLNIQLLHNLTKLEHANTFNWHYLFKLNVFPFLLKKKKDLWIHYPSGKKYLLLHLRKF